MRQLFLGLTASVALVAIGGAAFAWQAGHYRNIPGQITGSYAAGIKGSFRFVPVGATEGIPSAPSGGACILFRAEDLGFEKMAHKRCTKDKQCKESLEVDGKVVKAHGYCDTSTNKCWARPMAQAADPQLCLRGQSAPINTDIEISATSAAISTPAWHVSNDAQARVLTCLNSAGGRGCANDGTPFAYEWGDPKQL